MASRLCMSLLLGSSRRTRFTIIFSSLRGQSPGVSVSVIQPISTERALPLGKPPILAAEPACRLTWPCRHEEKGKDTNNERQQALLRGQLNGDRRRPIM